MKKILIIIILNYFISNSLVCQNPGYFGKKLIAGAGIEISPAFSQATHLMPVNLTGKMFVEKAIEHNLSFGIAVNYSNTKYDNRQAIGFLGSPNDNYQIQNIALMPFFKIYHNKFVAPWGKYFTISPIINTTITQHDDFMYLIKTIENRDTLLMDFGGKRQLFQSFDLLVGKGKTRIINDKLALDYGLNIQILGLLKVIMGDNYTSLDTQNYIRQTAMGRVRRLNSINLHLKIGYLF